MRSTGRVEANRGSDVLSEGLERPAVETEIAKRRRRLTAFVPLFAISVAFTLVLGVLSSPGPVQAPITAAVTTVMVLVLSWLALRPCNPRAAVLLVAMVLAASPALIFAAAIVTFLARLGLPVDVVAARLSAVGGWWLALAALRPLTARLGSRELPLRLAGVVMAPTAVILGVVGFSWNAKSAGAPQRLAYLYSSEDNAAWVSHAYAILRHGHLPKGIGESAYYSYSALSSMPGILGYVAVRGRPPNRASLAYDAVNITAANELLSVVASAAVVGLVFIAALLWTQASGRPALGGVFLWSSVLTVVGASIVATSPSLIGHLSLAWAAVALILLGLMVVLAIQATSWWEFAPAGAAACVAAYAATGSWAYSVGTPVIFAVLLISIRKSGLRAAGAPPIGHGPRVIALGVGIIVTSLVAALSQIVGSLSLVGVEGLTGAEGGVVAVEPLTLVGALAVGLGAGALAYRRADPLALVAILLIASASVPAVLVFGSGVLPGNTPTYSLTKSLYIVLAVAPLAAAALLAHVARSAYGRLLVIGALVLSSLITTSPAFGSVLKLPGAFVNPDPGTAARILALTARGAESGRVVCQPSQYVSPFGNYQCNRWTDAMSPLQGTADFRLDVLHEAGAAPKTWAAAQASGYLRHATIGDAAEITTGRCIPDIPTAVSRRKLDVTAAPTSVSLPPRTGHIDTMQRCAEGLTVIGWAPFTEVDDALNVWADGPVKVISAARVERPDVVGANKALHLLAPGFVIVLDLKDAKDAKLCLSLRGVSSLVINGSHRQGCTGG